MRKVLKDHRAVNACRVFVCNFFESFVELLNIPSVFDYKFIGSCACERKSHAVAWHRSFFVAMGSSFISSGKDQQWSLKSVDEGYNPLSAYSWSEECLVGTAQA